MLKVQARSIVRFAKQHGITLTRGGVEFPNLCARAVLAYALRIEQGEKVGHGNTVGTYKEDVENYYGLTCNEINGLEDGFETRYHSDDPVYDLRYTKVGRNVAKLAGLAFN